MTTTFLGRLYNMRRGEEKNPVYKFFVEGRSKERKQAYSRALEAATKDQRGFLSTGEKMLSKKGGC